MDGVAVQYAPAYEPFFSAPERYAILYGGAGSGKSYAAAQKIVWRCISEQDAKHIFLVCRKYKSSIDASVFRLIKDVIDSFGLVKEVEINYTRMSFEFWNGNMITTTGLDDTEKLKSIHRITGVWIEEAHEVEYEYFKELNRRLRGHTRFYKQIIFTFNPISETLWLKHRFFDAPQLYTDGETGITTAPQKDIYTLHTTFEDNPFIDKEYKEVLRQEYQSNDNDWRIYIEGEWGRIRTGCEFYAQFKFTDHVGSVEYKNVPLHISFDFNVNPYMLCTVWQIVYEDEIYYVDCIDEIALKNPHNTTEKVCDKFLERWEDKLSNGLYVYGDATGKVRSAANNYHNWDIVYYKFRKYMQNYSDRVPLSNPLTTKRRQFINRILNNGYNIRFRISEKCALMIADIENVLESADGGKLVKKKRDTISGVVFEEYGHFSDTMDYFLCSAFESYYNNDKPV